MAKLYDLARMTTATTGTGTITLGSAVTGYLSFANAGISDGDVIDYAINDPGSSATASEIGTGTYTAAATTLTRTVTKSTNSNTAINLSGNAHVFITPRAETLGYAGQRPGTTTNDAASAGNVGEFVSSTVARASPVSLTSATAETVTSISLTAGDWDVRGMVWFVSGATTTISQLIVTLSTTTNTFPSVDAEGWEDNNVTFATGSYNILNVGPARFSLSSTTTVYMIAQSTFGVSTMGAAGILSARRMR